MSPVSRQTFEQELALCIAQGFRLQEIREDSVPPELLAQLEPEGCVRFALTRVEGGTSYTVRQDTRTVYLFRPMKEEPHD